MHFAFDIDQLEFRSHLRGLLDRECTAADVRAAFELALDGRPPDRERWTKLASMGVVGMTVPESFGGLGLGAVDLVGLLEEAGRAGLPEPLAETTGIVVPLLTAVSGGPAGGAAGPGGGADGGGSQSAAVAADWLRKIATGEVLATIVPSEGKPAAWVDGADLVVVIDGDAIIAVSSDDLEATPVGCLDASRRLGLVAGLNGRRGGGGGSGSGSGGRPAGSVVVEGPAAAKLIGDVRRRGAVVTAAGLLGVADRLISMACEHARDRQQFGRPIGSFQAVKHHLATAFVHLEMARPVVYAAAWAIDEAVAGSDVGAESPERECSMAKALASEAALEAARVALQVHGAIGYTWEHDLHFWMKRAWVLASSWGDASSHFAKILETLTTAN